MDLGPSGTNVLLPGAAGDVSRRPFLLVSSPGVYCQAHPGFLERLPLSVRAEMSLQSDEWVQKGVATSPAWGMSTHVTSQLCKNWAIFGQGGEVLAKAVSLLTDSYLLRGGKTTIKDLSVQHGRTVITSSAVHGLLFAKHP